LFSFLDLSILHVFLFLLFLTLQLLPLPLFNTCSCCHSQFFILFATTSFLFLILPQMDQPTHFSLTQMKKSVEKLGSSTQVNQSFAYFLNLLIIFKVSNYLSFNLTRFVYVWFHCWWYEISVCSEVELILTLVAELYKYI
jgi:hypothetical protein